MNVVKGAVGINPAAAPAIVGAIARAVPDMASVAAGAAAAEQPKQASAIAKAAAAAAPSKAGKIVTAVCRAVPNEYRNIAVAVSQVVPASGKEIAERRCFRPAGFEARRRKSSGRLRWERPVRGQRPRPGRQGLPDQHRIAGRRACLSLTCHSDYRGGPTAAEAPRGARGQRARDRPPLRPADDIADQCYVGHLGGSSGGRAQLRSALEFSFNQTGRPVSSARRAVFLLRRLRRHGWVRNTWSALA